MPRVVPILLLAGCAADIPLLDVPVIIDTSAAEVTTDDGVSILLDTATYTLADLRLEHPADTTASLWQRLSPIATATAHPGHDFNGGVGGELTGTWVVDLLDAPTDAGTASIYAGPYATGHLTLPEDGVVHLSGTATTPNGPVPFDFTLTPDQDITGVPFEATLDAEAPPAGIVLSLDLGHALSFVDWATPDDDDDGVLTTTDGLLANTVLFGVVATPTFALSLETP